jgi:hypothetical protein
MKTSEQRIARRNMRAYAKLYRDALVFARRYQDYNVRVFEKWCVRAGLHLAEALREREISQS